MSADVEAPACDRENMLLWVQAMESEEFPQGRGYLHSNGKLCCMGVACVLAVRNGVKLEVTQKQFAESEIRIRTIVQYSGEQAYLPRVVRDWLGLPVMDPVIGTGECGTAGCTCSNPVRAQRANDELHWTFPQIAASIRAYYHLGGK